MPNPVGRFHKRFDVRMTGHHGTKGAIGIMPHFFVPASDVQDTTVTLTGENARHAAYSLRLAVGDMVTVSDQRRVYTCVLTRFGDGVVEADIRSVRVAEGEPPYRAILYQALPKGDKLDTIIQKAVECGVSEVVPFESSRCIMRSKPDAEERKTIRRARIAEEAAKQCRRGVIPTIRRTVTDMDAVLREMAACDLALFCYEGRGTRSLRELLDEYSVPADHTPTIAIVIGSEGGFSPEEAAAAAEKGACMCGLGPRILRTETASGFVLSCLAYRFEL